ncbi:MAG: hypothetical protein QOJ68_860 [Blastococcus sp.]|nr:hypothetical protein [Blastococcus sp.]
MNEGPLERSLFANGGELGRAMSAKDWATTPLGDPAGWPVALRNAVRILLTSRFSMWMAWGPELTMFYNDSYERDTLQAKHPWALGRPAGEVWAEIWHDIGPRIQKVLDTGIATWDEDLQLFLERSGYPEETYHTFSYSPLDGDVGGIEGMLCVVTETTERVVGERRMTALRDLAAAVATTRTEADVLSAVTEQLRRELADLPFSLTYLIDDAGTARLASATGIEPGSAAAPPLLQLTDPTPVWPLARIRAGEQVLVEDLADTFPDLPTGAWARPPAQAVAVPIASATQDGSGISGFLVVGLNPHRRYDDSYRGFVELIANQIASGLTNARSYEAERHRAEALAELDRAKTDFFSNVSHEFRTPLTLIMGPVAELRSSPLVDGDPRLREEIQVIERNALRLGKLVNTLLDFSRIQAGRIEARFEPVDLAAATVELASVFRSAVERAGLTFVVDCRPLGEPVYIDRDMWERIVLNLLSNALKFTFIGEIAVRLRQVDGAARLTVTDSGTGIPADELPRLFERFHRVAAARGRSGEGSGIGLAMVRELVSLHGGTIDVTSAPDAGTVFTIDLPLGSMHLPVDRLAAAPAAAPAASAAAASFVAEALRWVPVVGEDATAEPPGSSRPAAWSGRVLVADDNADMREYLLRLLEPRYDVAAVGDGRAAFEAALSDPPDLLVSDVMMPGMDGMDLLAALRADPRTARIPVVLLSARAGQQAAVEGLAAGADDYLVKPFSAEELLARVSAHLQLGRARRAAEERFTAMADLAPALIWVTDADGQRVFTNRGWTSYTGRSVQDELGTGWLDRVHPEDRQRYLDVVGDARAAGRGWEIEFRLGRADGAFHWLLERAAPIGAGEAFAGYVGSCTDINARFRETERQTLLAVVGAELDRETSPAEQLARLARLVVESRLADMCTVRRVDADGRLQSAGVAALDPATEAELAALEPHTALGVEVLAAGRSLMARADGPEGRQQPLGMYSSMALPLLVRGQVVAVLGVGRRADAPPFNDDDRMLAEEITARAALALDNAVLLAEERAAAQRLALLQQVTAELSAATTPVEVAVATAGRIRQLTGEASRVAVYELDASHRGLAMLTISGGSEERQRLWSSVPLSAPLAAARAVREGMPIWIEDLSQGAMEPRELPEEVSEAITSFGLAATVALPLAVAGRVVGVIGIAYPSIQRFSPTDRSMLLAVAEQCAQALDRARLFRSERGIAATLQRSLLPAELPGLRRLALAAHYLPGAEGSQAGGDWYDVVELDGDLVGIAVGDVVGQGPAAAAVMGQLRSALSTALLQGCGPAEALELLDRFAARLPGALASTAACLLIDPEAGTIRWSRAGHLPPLLLTPDGGYRLLTEAGAGAVLGAVGRDPYTEGTVDIAPGATLLLYTDGLVERRGELLDDGLDRLGAVAGRHGAVGPDLLTDRLLAEILADTDQPDDVAVIAARLLPDDLGEALPADPGRLAEIRRHVRTWSARAGLSEEVREDLLLVLGEALANAVEHAYAYSAHGVASGQCEYLVRREPDGSVRVRVTDGGVWRPPPEDKGHRGRGLELIAALAVDVEIGPAPGPGAGTVVSFRLPPVAERAEGDGRRTPGERTPPIPPRRSDAWTGDGVPARVTSHEGPTGLRLEVAGELDLGSATVVRGALVSALQQLPRGAIAELDLTATTYLASAGVGMLLALLSETKERGIELRLRSAEGSATARVFALTGLGGLLEAAAGSTAPSSGG